MTLRFVAPLAAALLATGCSRAPAPRPLMGGPPPEYETPRSYNGLAGDAPATPTPEEIEPPPTATPAEPAPTPAAPPK